MALAATAAGAQTGAPCAAPSLEVQIVNVTLSPDGSSSAVLHVADVNPAEQVTGYNLYRSLDPSFPKGNWTVMAVNAADVDPASPGIQLLEPSSGAASGDVAFYLVTAHNGPCALEGPWKVSSVDDFDDDGVGAEDDPCPTTPEGAIPVTLGCSATDLLLRPDVLVGPVADGIDGFLAGNAGAGVPVPDTVLAGLDAARIALASAYDELRDAAPCPAAASLDGAAGHLDDAVLAIEEYLAGLSAGGSAPGPTPGEGAGAGGGTEGPIEWPPPEVLHWQAQHHLLGRVASDATRSAALADPVCAREGPRTVIEGRVRSIDDEKRLVELEGGERIVLAWTATQQGSDRLSTDANAVFDGYDYGGFFVIKTYLPVPTSTFGFPDLTYDGCLRLRILPVQPLPGYNVPQTSWIRHPPEGYLGVGGRLELEGAALGAPLGTLLIGDDSLCPNPGIFPGAGQDGRDVRLDYFYEVSLSYKPKAMTSFIGAILAYQMTGKRAISLPPDVDPTYDGTLLVTRLKRTCQEGIVLPVPWDDCKVEEVDATLYPIRVRQAFSYCTANYTASTFAIEDHLPGDWRQTQVQSVATPAVVPGPVTFSARGDRILNGNPVHNQPVGLNQAFAIYSPFGHFHALAGTNRLSFLDWPHIDGTRNGQPFRYTCGVPSLFTDVINTCADMPSTLYRLPFPFDVGTNVNQGNGGSTSHNTWQWYALDLSGSEGDALRAARGGTVIRVRANMTLNCKTQTCTNYWFPLLDEYGSHVAIRHQDASVSWYAHMVPFSAAVVVGQKVGRGTYLGQVGNTGEATGPHLHFHVTPTEFAGSTVLARYQAYSEADQGVVTCAVPQEDQLYYSTNLP
jgi:hypothetical protein